MRRVQPSNITDFVGKRNITFDALYSSDEEEAKVTPLAEPEPLPYDKGEDAISVWTQKVIESFEKASVKPLSTDFKESLGRLRFFRKPSVSKEKSSPPSVNTK